ncbi:hypothetical protein QA942_27845 [Streptomyces sp. B21-106]|uniref:hypothetical protein n=1 Tax=unclassified Streptomyces TaxID=2593676 RepID=UPI000708E3F1|nr:hypothetical protein ASE41_33200 [Streptomyces sp. Root264]
MFAPVDALLCTDDPVTSPVDLTSVAEHGAGTARSSTSRSARSTNAIAGGHKLMVKLDCAGHSVVWEMQYKNVHNLAKHWLKHLKVAGKTQGIFDMNTNGDISPAA